MSDRDEIVRQWTALDAVALAFEKAVRGSIGPRCSACAHEIFQPFHGCGVGKQKTFAGGGEDCARFELRPFSPSRDGEK